MAHRYALTLSCPDQPGIVAAITTALYANGGNIHEAQQYNDELTELFFARIGFGLADHARLTDLKGDMARIAAKFSAKWEVTDLTTPNRVLILASKFDHCLADLIYRYRIGEIPMELVGIVSNHPRETFRHADLDGFAFDYLPMAPGQKEAQEADLWRIVCDRNVDLVVLARYMQILSPELTAKLASRCINIHHSFLPGFKGARPYHQAHARGVKLIGATAHYVTSDLDEGPIIEQDVERVSHADTSTDLIRKGRDIERNVLSRCGMASRQTSDPQRRQDRCLQELSMVARVIDGTALAKKLRQEVADEVGCLVQQCRLAPTLAVVLVGSDPASEIYVASKVRKTREAGMRSVQHRLPPTTSQAELLSLIADLNHDAAVDGILVQLPLPPHMNAVKVLEAIDPAKDVDGFHPVNVGRLSTGARGLTPCTPTGCMKLIRSIVPEVAGLNAVVVGASNIVGKPMAQMLLASEATVTVAHARTRNLQALCLTADILVSATGAPGLVRGDWIKRGATVIDVGISRLPAANGARGKITGDVAFEEALDVAGAVTPVPGGVGPMTIACLLLNTLKAATRLGTGEVAGAKP